MIIFEDFERCSNCGNGNFYKQEIVTLHKPEFRTEGEPPERDKKMIYTCTNCKQEFKI